MRVLGWLAAFLTLFVPAALAQSASDFSGDWRLIDPAAFAADAVQAISVRVVGPPDYPGVLRVERQSAGGVRTDNYSIGIESGIVGGAVGDGRSRGRPTTFSSSTTWRANELVIQDGSYTGSGPSSGPYWEREEIWAIDAQAHLVITIPDSASGTEPRTTVFRYRRDK